MLYIRTLVKLSYHTSSVEAVHSKSKTLSILTVPWVPEDIFFLSILISSGTQGILTVPTLEIQKNKNISSGKVLLRGKIMLKKMAKEREVSFEQDFERRRISGRLWLLFGDSEARRRPEIR